MTEGGLLDRARMDFRARRWQGARDAYADLESTIDADDLRRFAECQWWLGEIDECLRLLDAAIRLLPDDAEKTAEIALLIALIRFTRGDVTIGAAWTRRAARILAAHPDSVQQIYLVYAEAGMGFDGTDETWSPTAAERASELASRLGRPDADALSLVVTGMRALRAGDVVEAFARLDDAMLHVVAGDIPPIWAGDILCTTIHACDEVADFRRMEEWTRATEEWSAANGSPPVYTGVCRVHRLELQSAGGDWPRIESELESVCDAITATDAWIAGVGWYQLGELRRLRGDRAGARVAYGQARVRGIDPLPGEALLDLHDGRAERAWTILTSALAPGDALRRSRLLRAAVEVALARGRRQEAGALRDELEAAASRFASDGFKAWGAHARALVALHDGDGPGAVQAATDALELFRRLGRRWEQAHVLVAAARAFELCGDQDAAAGAATRAHEILDELGAAPIAMPPTDDGDDILTAREREVIALVAAGHPNRRIAQELVISEKTVGRHLANIYIKLGVSSRTAASAWWYERGTPGIR